MLYARRKRLEAQAQAEAADESFWSEYFDENARVKLVYAFLDACGTEPAQQLYARAARTIVLRSGFNMSMRRQITSISGTR